MEQISFLFNTIHESVIKENGLKYGLMQLHKERIERAFEKAKSFHTEKKTNFLNLPERKEQLTEILEYSETLKKRFKNMIIVGIGGSSLGTEAIYNAFTQRYDHEFFPEKRKLYFVDNYDARLVEYLINNISLDDSVFVVISKSGGTLETMSQYFYIKDVVVSKKGLEYFKERLVFITDEKKGHLNKLNESLNVKKFIIPDNVGGRFSVFTPVGLLATSFIDIDITKILEGAQATTDEFLTTTIEDNNALKYSLIHSIYDQNKGFNTSVTLFYNDRFIKFSEWFRQLWGESLGKPSIDGSFRFGTAPLSFRGSTDQHSQLQQFIEGKNDKLYTVISFKESGEYRFEKPELDTFSYIEGYGFNDLLTAAKIGTVRSLIEVKRPVIEIQLSKFSEFEFGAFLQFFMIVTAVTGFLFEINPFDQPGVELGKNYSIDQLKSGMM